MPELVQLRPSQEEILTYRFGRMGISAVPGSGKTWTLSLLASQIILSGVLEPDQEVLVVTFSNSAVDNFSQRISSRLKEAGLLPGMGYRVRTLHGLAHDIIKERPDLAGLNNDFAIIDERETQMILANIAQTYFNLHKDDFVSLLKEDLGEYQLGKAERDYLPELIQSIANAFIRSAKDRQLDPQQLRYLRARKHGELPLLEMGIQLYEDYQKALNYRGGVDFDDLIRLALQCLHFDPQLVTNLQRRWPYILEDEAQDSSVLQQQTLSTLVGEDGNWVRVGDPNQAIYESFTTANPNLLKRFIADPVVRSVDLPESGRSSLSIIKLANYLIDWTQTAHFNLNVRDALSPPHIQPTEADDPQPNPPDEPSAIQIKADKFTTDQELSFLVKDLQSWLPAHPDQTVAVLVPTNKRANQIVSALKESKLEVVESLLRLPTSTRLSAGAIALILKSLADPKSARLLAKALEVWRRADREDPELNMLNQQAQKLIRKCKHVEEYLWPTPEDTWVSNLALDEDQPGILELLIAFRAVMQRWQQAVILPVDQLVLTIAQDLFLDPIELAVAHKLALTLRQLNRVHPDWQLTELGEELVVIARNERRFLSFSEDEDGFNPDQHKGCVVVATIHKAKGLEWDKIYLTSVNNYDFPSGNAYDTYMPEKWYLKQNLNLEAETLAQLDILLTDDPFEWLQQGKAALDARQNYIRDRLRLLYVGITRARKALTITWNTGHNRNMQEAIPLVALRNFWNGESNI